MIVPSLGHFYKVVANQVPLYSNPMILISPLKNIIIDWSFIIDLLTCWALSSKDSQQLVSHLLLYNTLFFCVSSFLAINTCFLQEFFCTGHIDKDAPSHLISLF